MSGTKTTFYLPPGLRDRLKLVAARSGRTLSELLTEGAEFVVARHDSDLDKAELQRRAAQARAALRQGLYDGEPVSDEADRLVYGS
jgi:predicted DNA-binding protein